MTSKPNASGYSKEQSELVRATCLYVATKLGDLMEELVIIGGLVPSLLIDQSNLAVGVEPHVGTMDLDIGLQVALLEEERYKTVSERLKAAGFKADVNEKGHLTRQRWVLNDENFPHKIMIDFVIPPSLDGKKGRRVQHLQSDFAATIISGLQMAFIDQEKIVLNEYTIYGEKAERTICVCGAGAYLVLKALAFRNRGENKDAYDLYYVLRNYGSGIGDVVEKLKPLLADSDTQKALEILKEDFVDIDSLGPIRVAKFITGIRDENIQADVVGFVSSLLFLLEG